MEAFASECRAPVCKCGCVCVGDDVYGGVSMSGHVMACLSLLNGICSAEIECVCNRRHSRLNRINASTDSNPTWKSLRPSFNSISSG
jgi:hypothetical protein